MHGRELPVHGHSEHLRHQVRPQQVRDGLVVLEVGRANPDLSQQPVELAVCGQEDGVVLARGLFELVGRLWVREEVGNYDPVRVLEETAPVWQWEGSYSACSCRGDTWER